MIVKMHKQWITALCLGLIGAMASPCAHAFFLQGGFDIGGQIVFQKWRFAHFDNDNDGQVGPEEGIEVFIEDGPNGFSDDQIAQIEDAFAVWRSVPTSYAGFRVGGFFQDVVTPGTQDGLTTLQLAHPDEPEFDVLPTGFNLLSLTTFQIDDTIVDVNNISTIITGGTIIDADMVLDGTLWDRDTGGTQIDPFTVTGATVSLLGRVLGLSDPPPYNLRTREPFLVPIEDSVFWLRDSQSQRRRVGLTSSVSLNGFITLDEVIETSSGRVTIPEADGWATLAPSDISAVSFLYPRGDQSKFFRFQNTARTQARVDLPSLPLPNALVTAWIDHDGNEETDRLPFMSTLTGLYEKDENDARQGIFNMLGLWKRIEVEGGEGEIDATYTFTISPLNESGVNRLAPPTYTVDRLNLIDGSTSETIEQFLSETFNEFGNIVDLSNYNVGTPMRWDSGRNKLVSDDTGRTLGDILPGRSPMFGDAQAVCPLNVIVGGGGGDIGTDGGDTLPDIPALTSLRSWRDDTLLRSAVGAAVVDVYYTAAPKLADYVAAKPARLRAATAIVEAFTMVIGYQLHLLMAACLMAGLAWRGLRARRIRRGVQAGLFMLGVLMAGNAAAQIETPDTATLTESADVIIETKVVAIESYHEGGRTGNPIYTDVSVEVQDAVKGPLNKQSVLTFTQPGGRVDDLVTRTNAFPFFKEGDEAVLYLEESDRFGYMLAYGFHGRLPVDTEEETGVKTVRPGEFAQAMTLQETAEKIAEVSGEEAVKTKEGGVPRVDLAAYLDYVQSLVWEQAAAEEGAE
ncbi:MAG: hypothetical protein ACLFTT_06020 [Candidatus Hydrogenedentota bacterium]